MQKEFTIQLNQTIVADLDKNFETEKQFEELLEKYSSNFNTKIDEINNFINESGKNIDSVKVNDVILEFKKCYINVIVNLAVKKVLEEGGKDFGVILCELMKVLFLQSISGKTMISAVESVISNRKDYELFEACAKNSFFALLEEHFLGEPPSWVKVFRNNK